MGKKNIDKTESYDLLSRLGKKVLRPGGLKLTQQLIKNLNISDNDDVVEFAPGLGFTAEITLAERPRSYIGIEREEDSVADLKQRFPLKNCQFFLANVAKSGLPDESVAKVYGEAMLTMHADHRKSEIIAEANRILKIGGLYGIHELGLVDDHLSENDCVLMKQELARVSHVNARPLTTSEWQILLEKQGFKVLSVSESPMLLLEPRRMLADEGVANFIKIIFNLLTHPEERKRVLALRKTFKKYAKNLNAVAIVAQKF